MKQTPRKFILCLLLCLLMLAGCGGDQTGRSFRYDIPDPITNLDPQFATSTTARMILQNLFEGLLTRTPEGELLPGVATDYTVSGDGLTYTFNLREDARWRGGDMVTADDFVFTFRRMFRDGSPHARSYAAIRGAEEILDGRSSLSGLGVFAEDDHTLIIKLARPDPIFLERLTDPAAAPCNERAYTESRGRYGLEANYVCCNGPFEISRWDNTRLSLRRNEDYRSDLETVAGGVHFYIGRDAAKQFSDGKTDLALLTRGQIEGLNRNGAQIQLIGKTVWCIVFNQDDPLLGNALLRQSLAYTVDHKMLAMGVSASYQTTLQLVPDAMRVMGKPYRELVSVSSPLAYNSQEGKRLYHLGLAALGLDKLPATTILIPEDAKAFLNIDAIQQGWQKELAAYVNFDAVDAAQIQRRLREGDYQMLLMPITPADSNVETLLGAFTSYSPQNYFGYRNILYDELLAEAARQQTAGLAASKYAQAEMRLLADAVVIPLYFEPSSLLVAPDITDIQISPFGDFIYFKYAKSAH